ncbi:hypothetical protein AB0L00_18120 [Actinoallomurus sp. NPDC052308]|uniref:hypothetical protein n=1 Tax=Actinoallomurus sp. NPDC052308 TaxID=3155530 RepID=UPI0034267C51
MGISRRMGVAISGLAFAGATVATLGAAGPASAQTATITPQHSVTASYSRVTRHRHGRAFLRHRRAHLRYGRAPLRRWRTTSGTTSSYSYSYYKRTSYWYWWGGCGCCC